MRMAGLSSGSTTPSTGRTMPLYVVATPIGTLGDLSPRAREVLGSVAAIACEDTRSTRKLLSACDVDAPELVAVHAHNEDRVGERIAERALTEDIALVSDAGTPAVSDPGGLVVAAAHARGVQVLSVPGPSALASALAASGFPAAPSTFLGFAPRKRRDGFADELLGHTGTVLVYEAPGRVGDLVERLAARQPERMAVISREISKKFEEHRRGPLASLDTTEIRGECVLVVGPGDAYVAEQAEVGGGSLKEVAAVLAERWGIGKREAYQHLLSLEREVSESER
ncbi:MAG: rRNA small subunit methyltransferase 1 [Deltaproteobacteria bacterium]|nr:MAG: rRNA small subunit methyltransferase 1 [Deltaproteobacteria bacterium]